MELEKLIRAKQAAGAKRPPRIGLHAIPGWGKTTWATSLPKPFFLDCEKGGDELKVTGTDISSIAELNTAISLLRNEKHDFKTVVIDTATALEKIFRAEISKKFDVFAIEDIEWGKGGGHILAEFTLLIKNLESLQEKGLATCILLHTEPVLEPNCFGDDFLAYTPILHKKALPFVLGWLSNVFFGNTIMDIVKKDEGFGKIAKAEGDGKRIIYTDKRPAFMAKNRMGLPFDIAWPKGEAGWNIVKQNIGKG